MEEFLTIESGNRQIVVPVKLLDFVGYPETRLIHHLQLADGLMYLWDPRDHLDALVIRFVLQRYRFEQ